jgi:multiple sugar transport system substrate-binding protein
MKNQLCLSAKTEVAGVCMCGQQRVRIVFVMLIALMCLAGIAQARQKVSIIGPFTGWGDSLQEALNTFAYRHDVDVELINTPGWTQTREKAAAMAAAGVPPDVLYGDGTAIGFYAGQHISQPLDALIARDIDYKRYPAAVRELFLIKGKLWALPTALSLHNTYYRPELFNQMGLSPISRDWASDDFTWDDFVNLARKLTRDLDGDGQTDQYATQAFGAGGGMTMLGMWGLNLVDYELTRFLGNTPEVIEALEKTTSLWTVHRAVGGNFMASTAAMYPVQSYFLNNLSRVSPDFDWAVGIMPKGTHRANQAGFQGLALAGETPNAELAWKLLKYLAYDTEGAIPFTRAENRVPVLPDTGRDFIRRWSSVVSPQDVQAITDGISYVYDTLTWRHPNINEIHVKTMAAGDRATRGDVSVRQAMEEVAPTINALLRDGSY